MPKPLPRIENSSSSPVIQKQTIEKPNLEVKVNAEPIQNQNTDFKVSPHNFIRQIDLDNLIKSHDLKQQPIINQPVIKQTRFETYDEKDENNQKGKLDLYRFKKNNSQIMD